jgi:hypothetical protein
VLYIYELQLAPAARRNGVGKFLTQVLPPPPTPIRVVSVSPPDPCLQHGCTSTSCSWRPPQTQGRGQVPHAGAASTSHSHSLSCTPHAFGYFPAPGEATSYSDGKVANRNGRDSGWEIAHATILCRFPSPIAPRTQDACTRTTRKFGICPSFKDHFLSPVLNPNDTIRNFFYRCTASPKLTWLKLSLLQLVGLRHRRYTTPSAWPSLLCGGCAGAGMPASRAHWSSSGR